MSEDSNLKEPVYCMDLSMQVELDEVAKQIVVEAPRVPMTTAPPGQVNANRRYGDRLCLPGFGPEPCDLMFVATSVFEEETEEIRKSGYFGRVEKQVPRMFRGPASSTLEAIVASVGISRKEFFYTALCRWLLPKNERSRPKTGDLKWAMPALMHDIEKVKPKIIVTFGKPAFDALSGLKLKATDIEGGWFTCQHDPTILLYPMFDLFRLITQPSSVEQFRVDFMEVARGLRESQGVVIPRIELHYETINNSAELRAWVQRMRMRYFVFCVDCEWHGSNHVDGQLRSIQFAWEPGYAVYVRFSNEKNEYVFDVSYKEAGAILNEWLAFPSVFYTGHHIAADFPWMECVLGIPVEGRCVLDTEFALQCVNEHDALGLERVAMKLTDLGRYDIPLVMWKKAAGKKATEDGYGFIPDDIIIPYAQRDVDVGIRAYPKVLKMLQTHGVYDYYNNMFNPFVTDVFTRFTIDGLPMNRNKMGKMRELFHFVYQKYELEFRRKLFDEAIEKLKEKMVEILGEVPALECAGILRELFLNREQTEAQSTLINRAGAVNLNKLLPWFEHARDAADFKIRSSEQMKRWLFTVKGFTPIKSTANKAKGTPSVDWSKVLSYPEKARADFTPSTDKQSLQILCDTNDDAILTHLLELNAVGNLCRAFLGEADTDENGEVIKEKGLHLYVASDDRVHGQYSTTETGRPRSWKPNALNWPSYVNKKIESCMRNVLSMLMEQNQLPPQFKEYITHKEDGTYDISIPPIRSCVEAPEGWLLVESDYKTAELRGNAFIAGDENMIKIMTEPDEQFAFWAGDPENKTLVRLRYDENCGVTKRDVGFLYSYKDPKDKVWKRVTADGLKRDENGNLLHPSADLHWSLAEMVHGKPREALDEKKDRGAAKVGNFSSAYGATPNTLERKIESDTGIKPEEGTGQRILDALRKRQPVACEYLDTVEQYPRNPGFMVAQSGRIRHFVLPKQEYGISSKIYESSASSQGREARNFPMQESVAATAIRAATGLLKFSREWKLAGFTVAVLYDSVVTCCPEEEKHIWKKAHHFFMYVHNRWMYHGRILAYPIDTEYNAAWSAKPTAAQKKWLYGPVSEAAREKFSAVEAWLDKEIALAEEIIAQNELDWKGKRAK